MQEFLTHNKVSCNLMSLTGYRTLVILGALLESPKSNDEINEYLFNNQYIKEKFSGDTLRIYINSLRAIGCEITRANQTNNKKYILKSHPFTYNIPKSQLVALQKLYKNIYGKLSIRELIELEDLFFKLAMKTENENTRSFLQNISLLKNINRNILNDLLLHCNNKNQIVFLYNSLKSGERKIEIIADKLSFKSDKLYLFGTNLTHKQYSFFPVEKILNICEIKFSKNNFDLPPLNVKYEIYDKNYILEPDEKIIQKSENIILVESNAKNEFSLMQRILSMTDECKVVEPEDFKQKLIEKLKKMESGYENI